MRHKLGWVATALMGCLSLGAVGLIAGGANATTYTSDPTLAAGGDGGRKVPELPAQSVHAVCASPAIAERSQFVSSLHRNGVR
jgi:hypothetical protein